MIDKLLKFMGAVLSVLVLTFTSMMVLVFMYLVWWVISHHDNITNRINELFGFVA